MTNRVLCYRGIWYNHRPPATFVSIFMVAGGYGISQGLLHVLSKPELSSSQGQVQFWERLSGAPVRRVLRLYAPVALLMVASHVLYFSGAYATWTFPDVGAEPLDRPLVHAWFAVTAFLKLLDPLTGEKAVEAPGSLYIHLWTIPVELRGSFGVILLLLSLGRVSVRSLRGRRIRLAVERISAMWCLWRGRVDDLGFILGLIIAEVNCKRSSAVPVEKRADLVEKGHECVQQVHNRHSRQYTTARCALLIFALLALSIPTPGLDTADDSITRTQLFPQTTWPSMEPRPPVWHTLGAAGLVAFVLEAGQENLLRRGLESLVVQAVGRHSFVLYLVHIPVIQIVRNPVLSVVDRCIGNCESRSRSWIAWSVASMAVAAVVAIVTKLAATIDKRCVHWSRNIGEVLNKHEGMW